MKRLLQIAVCAMLISGLAFGAAQAQYQQAGNYIEQVVALGTQNPSESVSAAPNAQAASPIGYAHPASAGYSSRPILAAQPAPGHALARRPAAVIPSSPADSGLAKPPRRAASKCKPDQMGACGPQPYPAPFAAMPYGPRPMPCGPICVPDPVNWY